MKSQCSRDIGSIRRSSNVEKSSVERRGCITRIQDSKVLGNVLSADTVAIPLRYMEKYARTEPTLVRRVYFHNG